MVWIVGEVVDDTILVGYGVPPDHQPRGDSLLMLLSALTLRRIVKGREHKQCNVRLQGPGHRRDAGLQLAERGTHPAQQCSFSY